MVDINRLAAETGTIKGTQRYGISGSVLALNPTARRVEFATGLSSPELREPVVIRSWPDDAEPPIPPPVPAISTIDNDGVTITVNGSDFTPASVIHVDGVATPTTYVGATALTAAPVQVADVTYSVTVVDPGTGTSNAVTFTGSPPAGDDPGDDPC